MTDEQWEIVAEVAGPLQAEMLRGLLEAQEIPVILSQEGAGRAYGLTVGLLGRVQLLVPTSALERARQVLDEYDAGYFEGQSLAPSESQPETQDSPPQEAEE